MLRLLPNFNSGSKVLCYNNISAATAAATTTITMMTTTTRTDDNNNNNNYDDNNNYVTCAVESLLGQNVVWVIHPEVTVITGGEAWVAGQGDVVAHGVPTTPNKNTRKVCYTTTYTPIFHVCSWPPSVTGGTPGRAPQLGFSFNIKNTNDRPH